MKTNSRIRSNHNPKPAATQGQNPTELGQINRLRKDYMQAKKLCALLKMNENRISALALLSDWEGVTPADYCCDAVLAIMQATYDKLLEQGRNAATPEERERIINTLAPLDGLFQQPAEGWRKAVLKPAAPDPAHEIFDASTELECAVMQSKALAELMVIALDSESADVFHANNGHLAAGLQELTRHTNKRLSSAFDHVHKAGVAITR